MLIRIVNRLAIINKKPPNITACNLLLSNNVLITQPKPRAAIISGRTINILNRPINIPICLAGISLAIRAYGIETIEKHITTDRNIKLEDFEAALSGNDFCDFVKFIKTAEIAIGDGNLEYLINPENEKYRLVLRKRIIANEDIKEGDLITEDKLTFMRCDYGLELEHLKSVINKKATKLIKKYSGITLKNVK